MTFFDVQKATVACCGLLLLCGCAEPPVPAPTFSVPTATDAAIKDNDKNSDGQLDKTELASVPGLLVVLPRWDKNSDGKLSKDEVKDGLQAQADMKFPLVQFTCELKQGGSPVKAADVKFVPEGFMGPMFKPASGTTDEMGVATLTTPDEPLPGIRCGIYRVEVTRGGKPPVTLGYEVSLTGEAQSAIRLTLPN